MFNDFKTYKESKDNFEIGDIVKLKDLYDVYTLEYYTDNYLMVYDTGLYIFKDLYDRIFLRKIDGLSGEIIFRIRCKISLPAGDIFKILEKVTEFGVYHVTKK